MERAGRVLVFRLGRIGFAMPLDHLLEIREEIGLEQGQALSFRGEPLSWVDLRSAFELSEGRALKNSLIIGSPHKPRALLVERVEGIFERKEQPLLSVPPMLVERTLPWYDHVILFRGEPLVWCKVETWPFNDGAGE